MSNRRVGVWRWSVACALSIISSLALSAVAAAQDEQGVMPPQPPQKYYEDVSGHGELPNMFETNVPYVAWRGEQIRAVKCDRDYAGVKEADVIVGDWSGDGDFKPELESTQFEAFTGSNRKPCVAFNMLAHRPGMAFVVLTPKDPNPEDYYVPAKHTFIMIWMSIKDVSIDEVGPKDPTGDAPEGSNAEIGDRGGDGYGDGIFKAGDPYGRVAVKVKGTFPAFDGGPAWTLPNDWASLAVYATDQYLGNYRDPMRWDIHDDQTKVIGHKWGFCYPPFADPPAPHTDAVDNCNGGGDLGHFSTVFGTGNLAAGPFDPARPATLLSNGQLNAGDAPMPALRVNVKIKPNSGEDGDLSGAGQLLKSDKSDVYSHDGSGADNTKRHNLYAPYYKQFIPATYPIKWGIPEASGIDGPCQINDNVGFAWPCGLYDNWDTYETRWAKDGPTQCNKYVDWEWSIGYGDRPNGNSGFGGGGGHYDRPDDTPRRNPYGPQSVWVYTDEHGEAQVRYDPYAGGFHYDNLIGDGPGQAILNDNRGCDLQDVDLLGTSEISASADYPYLQVGPNVPVDAAPASITKQVFNEFDKSMYYYPKGAGAANQNARIVVVHANDVNGEPFAGEKVCFYLDDEADGVRGFAGTTGIANGGEEMSMEELGRHHHGRPLPEGRFRVEGGYAHKVAGDICRTLDRNGNAAIEVFNSDPQDINVIAEFLEEGLLRDIDVDFRVAGSSSGGEPPKGNDDNNDCRRSHNGCPRSGDGTTPPSAAQIVQTAGPQAASLLASAKKAKPKARRITVRRVTLRKGKYALTIRVNSPRRSETVRIRVGKRSIKRRVATNRLVTLKGLPISKGVNVSVSLSS